MIDMQHARQPDLMLGLDQEKDWEKSTSMFSLNEKHEHLLRGLSVPPSHAWNKQNPTHFNTIIAANC